MNVQHLSDIYYYNFVLLLNIVIHYLFITSGHKHLYLFTTKMWHVLNHLLNV